MYAALKNYFGKNSSQLQALMEHILIKFVIVQILALMIKFNLILKVLSPKWNKWIDLWEQTSVPTGADITY